MDDCAPPAEYQTGQVSMLVIAMRTARLFAMTLAKRVETFAPCVCLGCDRLSNAMHMDIGVQGANRCLAVAF